MQTGHEIGFIFFPGGITVMPSMSRFRILLKDGCPSFWWSLSLVSMASSFRGSISSVWLSARYCLSISVDAFRAVVGIQYTLLVAAAGGSRWICQRPVVGHSENGTKCLCALSICMPALLLPSITPAHSPGSISGYRPRLNEWKSESNLFGVVTNQTHECIRGRKPASKKLLGRQMYILWGTSETRPRC